MNLTSTEFKKLQETDKSLDKLRKKIESDSVERPRQWGTEVYYIDHNNGLMYTVHVTTREWIGSAQTTSFAALFGRISARSSSRFDTWRPPGEVLYVCMYVSNLFSDGKNLVTKVIFPRPVLLVKVSISICTLIIKYL